MESGNSYSFAADSRTVYESGNFLRIDENIYREITNNQIDYISDQSDSIRIKVENEPMTFLSVGPYRMRANTSSNFIVAWVFGEDKEDFLNNVATAKSMYLNDFSETTLIVSNELSDLETPAEFSLSQNYPNPFNPSTNIEFSLSKSTLVSLAVYDITGREVRTFISEQTYTSGIHSVQFNASDLSSGVYIYQLRVADQVFTKKLTLIK